MDCGGPDWAECVGWWHGPAIWFIMQWVVFGLGGFGLGLVYAKWHFKRQTEGDAE